MVPSRRLHPLVITIVAAFVSASVAAADEPPQLRIGDPAPQLSISKWIKGEPIEQLEKGKVYVIDFWASWCPPCETTMPHLSALQKQYKDVTIIGVNTWEKNRANAEPFIKRQGDRVAYRVVMEEPVKESATSGRMAIDWLKAAGLKGIPSSFIVDQRGTIAWMGHPTKIARPLAAIVAGDFDAKAFAARTARIESVIDQAEKATNARDYDKALELRDALIEFDPDDADKHRILKLRLYLLKADQERSAKTADELLALAERNKDAWMAESVAYSLMNTNPKGLPVAPRALKAAQLAYQLGDKGLRLQRLLAQAHAANGQYRQAVQQMEKVLETSTGPDKADDEKLLREYRARQ